MANEKHLIAEAIASDYDSTVRPKDGIYWAGDQTGGELRATNWYDNRKHNCWAHIYRFTDESIANDIAQNAENIVLSGYVGYGSQSIPKLQNTYSLTRALVADNYNYLINGRSTIDFDSWIADGGSISKTTSEENPNDKYWFDPVGIKPQEWSIYNLKHECATQCSGLVYIAILMRLGLWIHKARNISSASGGYVYYVSNHVNINFTHPAGGSLIVKHLGFAKWSKPVEMDYSWSNFKGKCYSVDDKEKSLSEIYAKYPSGHGNDKVTLRSIVITVNQEMTKEWKLSTEKLKDDDGQYILDTSGNKMSTTVYRFLICDKVDDNGDYVPLMKEYIADEDGATLIEAEYQSTNDEDEDDSETENGTDIEEEVTSHKYALTKPTALKRGDILTARRSGEGKTVTGGHTAMWI